MSPRMLLPTKPAQQVFAVLFPRKACSTWALLTLLMVYNLTLARKSHLRPRSVETEHPVHSAIDKHRTGRLVLEWVNIWNSRLLYVVAISYSFT
jgi:hypothetical protein